MLALISTSTLRRIDRVLQRRGLLLGLRVSIAHELWLREAAETMVRDLAEEWPW